MKNRCIFRTLDASFDYYTPLGAKTEIIYEEHGFEWDTDNAGTPIISSLKGFGDFDDVEKCESLSEFYDYLDEAKSYAFLSEEDKNKKYSILIKILETQTSILRAALNGEPLTREEKEEQLKDDWVNFEVKRMREEEILGV